ncbi:hypothetical protein KIL84_018313 [Mauremys mutica]|uniref:Uncharacterized protein n=1 Tax=Mauremys mutica TaxID=74926 RepID=A0A9D4BA37_9SAUR|nr:hypothetical protein KIL84_018313 [Mauremys mutica]
MAPSPRTSSRKDANALPSMSSTFWAIMILASLLIAYCTTFILPSATNNPLAPAHTPTISDSGTIIDSSTGFSTNLGTALGNVLSTADMPNFHAGTVVDVNYGAGADGPSIFSGTDKRISTGSSHCTNDGTIT